MHTPRHAGVRLRSLCKKIYQIDDCLAFACKDGVSIYLTPYRYISENYVGVIITLSYTSPGGQGYLPPAMHIIESDVWLRNSWSSFICALSFSVTSHSDKVRIPDKIQPNCVK